MKTLCYVNGEILSTGDATLGISDLALQRGYGVFDFGRTYGGRLFHFEDNLARLRRSAAELHLKLPLSDAEIIEVATKLIRDSDLQVPAIRLILTGGYAESLPVFENPNFIIITEELPAYSPDLYEQGCRIITSKYQRELPHVKSINYLNAIRLEPLKSKMQAFDVLYYNDKSITECPKNNFFAFTGETLITPKDDILSGITRAIVLRLASEHFRVEERAISLEEIYRADEAFVTSTTKRVMPVSGIDDREVGDGRVGDRTKAVMRLFDEYTGTT
jgi:D-alanine transaminase/branched-chain amino acid aminotransferase